MRENKMNGFISNRHERFYIQNKKDFIYKLYKKNRRRISLKHKAINIDLNSHEIKFENGKKIIYDKLISTIPIDVFSLISGRGINIDEVKANLICCISKSRRHWFFENDFYYVPDFNYTFHSINVCRNKKMLIFEFCDDLGCTFDLYSFLGIVKMRIAKIFEKIFTFPIVKEPLKIEGVKFLGRFGTGDYETKVDDVIKEVEKWKTN